MNKKSISAFFRAEMLRKSHYFIICSHFIEIASFHSAGASLFPFLSIFLRYCVGVCLYIATNLLIK